MLSGVGQPIGPPPPSLLHSCIQAYFTAYTITLLPKSVSGLCSPSAPLITRAFVPICLSTRHFAGFGQARQDGKRSRLSGRRVGSQEPSSWQVDGTRSFC